MDADLISLVFGNLTLPYRAGAAAGPLTIDGDRIRVTTWQRHPVIALRLRRSLVDERLVVQVQGDGHELPPVVFAPFTLEGSTLPIVAPETTDDMAGPFEVRLRVLRQVGDAAFSLADAAAPPLDPEDLADLLEARLLTGVLGKLTLVGALEKQRIVRQAREIQGGRTLDLARRWSLDVHGIEHGVPRRTDLREDDAHYRARLAIFQRFLLPTPEGFRVALNGQGDDSEQNAGLPALVGVSDRFHIVEKINPLSVALRVVAVGDTSGIDELHERLQRDHLLDLRNPAPQALSPARWSAWEDDRRLLRDELTHPGGDGTRWMHPGAAHMLAIAVRLLRASGITTQIWLDRAYDPSGGSKFELGLGIVLRRLPDTDFDTLAERIGGVSGLGPEIDALAAGMEPRTREDDPLGVWFFSACGFATVEEHHPGTVLLSPFPMGGLDIEGPTKLLLGTRATYRVQYQTVSSGGLHVLAAAGRDRLGDAAAAAGVPAPGLIVSGQSLSELLSSIRGQGDVAIPTDLEPLVDAGALDRHSARYAEMLMTASELDESVVVLQSLATITGLGSDEELVDGMAAISSAILDAGFSSVRALWDSTGNRVAFVASISHLPGSLTVPGQAPVASYWWSETDMLASGQTGQRNPIVLKRDGHSTAVAEGQVSGVALVVVVGYHRLGLADPYEVRIELDDPGSVMSLDQYGYVMNLLEFMHPIGIEINTFDLRRRHVDVDGDGTPEWITSRASRSYHQFRQAQWSRRSADRSRYKGQTWPSK